MELVLGITTYNRLPLLKKSIDGWNTTRNKNHGWTLIVADDGSADGTKKYLKNLKIEGVKIHIIFNDRRGVHHQSNQILKLCSTMDFDFGFKADDDITYLKSGWDSLYINAAEKTGFNHLCFYDTTWGKRRVELRNIQHSSGLLVCDAPPHDVQGAFWTFTKETIQKVGYFDLAGFSLCGYGHTDYTWRCCRAGFNSLSSPYDVKGSNNYIRLLLKGYYPAVQSEVRYKWNTPRQIKGKQALLKQPRIYVPYNEVETRIE